MTDQYKTAYFAGGCFWCTEAAFQSQKGVIDVISGFAGGTEPNPTYRDVAYGKTNYREAVEVTYDPKSIDYTKLLEIFWLSIDPFDEGGQFADRGTHYTTAIYTQSDEETQLAQESKAQIENEKGKTVVTDILPHTQFFAAENSHQDFHLKNPLRYNAYKYGSGRVKKLKDIWGEN